MVKGEEPRAIDDLRGELAKLRTDVADLQLLRADVDHLKALVVSLQREVKPGRESPLKKPSLRSAAVKTQVGTTLQASRRAGESRLGQSTASTEAGEEEEPEPNQSPWGKARTMVPIIGRLAVSARMKRMRAQVQHHAPDEGTLETSALEAAAAGRVSIVDVAGDVNRSASTTRTEGQGASVQQGEGVLHEDSRNRKATGEGLAVISETNSDCNQSERELRSQDKKQVARHIPAPLKPLRSLAREDPVSEMTPLPPPRSLRRESTGHGSAHGSAHAVLPAIDGTCGLSYHSHRKHSERSHRPSHPDNAHPRSEYQTATSGVNSHELDAGPKGSATPRAGATGFSESTTMLVKKEEMKKKKSMWKEDDAWVQHTQNAYGAFAHVAMQSGILKAVQMCGPMLMASILIQTVFAAQLLYNHWTDMAELGTEICAVPASLQICASVIFLTLMFNEVPSMWQSCRLVLSGTHHFGGDGDTIGDREHHDHHEDHVTVQAINIARPTRVLIFILSVLTEISTWTSILMAGCVWIMVDVEETTYRIPGMGLTRIVKKHMFEVIEYYFGVYIYLILLISMSCSSVIGLRVFQSGCDSHHFWTPASYQGG